MNGRVVRKYTSLAVLVRAGLFLAALIAFARLVPSGLSFSAHQLLMEAPLAVLLYTCLRSALRNGPWPSIVAALPAFSLYGVFDFYFIMLGRVPRLSDVRNLPELHDVLPFWQFGGMLLLALLPLILCGVCLERRHWLRSTALLALIPVAAGIIHATPGSFLRAFERVSPAMRAYSDAENVMYNGRLAMLVYYEAQRRATDVRIAEYRDREAYEKRMELAVDAIRAHMEPRNIHLVVLESFVDPSLFLNVEFSGPPAHRRWRERYAPHMGYSRSPVFGGNTAQAEFELLCGVPALQRLAGLEFNLFTGSRAWCLPQILSFLGYRTHASNPYKPDFFNAWAAYQGAGFDNIYFPREFAPSHESYLSVKNVRPSEGFLFDGDLFAQNLTFIGAENSEQPMLNYVLGIYGHHPNGIDKEIRPPVVRSLTHRNDFLLEATANQHYYRTQALADYLDQLIARDPGSIIVVVSDHLPPLSGGSASYQSLGYLGGDITRIHDNRLLIYSGGRFVSYPRVHHHEVPRIILDELTDGWFCERQHCAFKEWPTADISLATHVDRYIEVMAHATE